MRITRHIVVSFGFISSCMGANVKGPEGPPVSEATSETSTGTVATQSTVTDSTATEATATTDTTTSTKPPVCPDSVCSSPDEDVDNCPEDCSICGDGIVSGKEDCEEPKVNGKTVDSPTCDDDCSNVECKDGHFNTVAECDDKGMDSADCDDDCSHNECKDEHLNSITECDDKGVDSKKCDSDCSNVSCGDGYHNKVAECDDNPNDSLMCDSDCTPVACGDGHVNTAAGEQCDDGNIIKFDGCSDTCQIECLVFVTNGIYDGAFGADPVAALTAADAKCQTSATMASLFGDYKAWLSNDTINAKDRAAGCVGPVIRSGDGMVIASDWSKFSTGAHNNPIEKNELGVPPTNPDDPQMSSPTTFVWTGTKLDGTAAVATCSNWTSNAGQGVETGRSGDYTKSDVSWTSAIAPDCNSLLHLYCVQTYVP